MPSRGRSLGGRDLQVCSRIYQCIRCSKLCFFSRVEARKPTNLRCRSCGAGVTEARESRERRVNVEAARKLDAPRKNTNGKANRARCKGCGGVYESRHASAQAFLFYHISENEHCLECYTMDEILDLHGEAAK
jgi:hypothetical protein